MEGSSGEVSTARFVDPVLEGIDIPETFHLRSIPAWWWIAKPRTAFSALSQMKEDVSARVSSLESHMHSSSHRGTASRAEEASNGSSASNAAMKMKLGEGITIPLIGDVKWAEITEYVVSWISNPLNVALTFWCILCIVPSLVIVLIDGGFLDNTITDEFVRQEWVETSDQILNALFVLMCLVWHPVFFRLTFQLYRWSPSDIQQLRYEYCRGGKRKPNEWWHMAVIFFCFHITCVATYALATLYWVYNRWERPSWAVLLTVAVSFGAPIVAFSYNIFSPLGKDFHLETEEEQVAGAGEESKGARRSKEHFVESQPTFILSQKVVPYPEWRGGPILGSCESPRIACLTCLFPFCVFGLNMERVGFGQFWVQTTCFVFIVVGPCLVFQISAHTTRFSAFEKLMTYTGLILAWLGLLYGAFWRYRMRTKFRLPAYRWCLGSPALTDAAMWLFCCCCALCQEVRTAEYYDIGDNIFFEKSEEEKLKREMLAGGVLGVGMGEASKKVTKFRQGLEDAGKGVVRMFGFVPPLGESDGGNTSGGSKGQASDVESGEGSSGVSEVVDMEAPKEVKVEKTV